MKRALVISSLAVLTTLLLSLAAVSQEGPAPPPEPYVRVQVTPRKFKLGSVPEPGIHDSPAILKVHVQANCFHAVMASASALETREGSSIPSKRIFVRIPKTGEYVPMKGPGEEPVAITGPDPMEPGVYHIDLRFHIETVLQNPPGKYKGKFIFTVTGAL